ncbi:MAG: hypothetical protein WBI57_05570 [Desulfobacterales bacterium]
MIEILGNFFEANPGKSTIVLKSTCSDCGDDVIIHITSTSSGFGLQGGALFKRSSDGYFAKCSDCYKINSKIKDLNMSKFARAY